MKALLFGMFFASPAVATWAFHRPETVAARPEIQAVSHTSLAPLSAPVVRVPVEVIAKGSAPHWVYVEVGTQAVPEPGTFSLLALTGLLLVFRRQRG